MKIALLVIDVREDQRDYSKGGSYFYPAVEALLQGMQRLPALEIHVVSCTQKLMGAPEKLADSVWFHSLYVPKLGWMRTGYQGCIRAARKTLKEIQPDIVHGQGTERDSALCAAFSGFPNVITIHGNMQAIAELYRSRLGSFHWLAGRLETVALRRTDGVFCNSAYTEGCVRPRTSKIWRVPNALRPAFFDRPRAARADNPPILLNVGSVLTYKQQVKILDVAGSLRRQGMKFQMHFAGARAENSAYGAAFTQRLAEAERDGYARHLGLLDTAQLIAAMDAASALVHFPTEESFGLVVAEALARNLKLFGAATGGVVDIARGVDGAELFPADDFSALEAAIVRWMNCGCPPPRNAAQIMCERYHPEVIARQHLEIYRQVLGK